MFKKKQASAPQDFPFDLFDEPQGQDKHRKWKSDRKKRKTLRQRLSSLTYMQTALTLFVLSALLFAFCLWRSVALAGGAGLGIAFLGILSFVLAFSGLVITLYGHFLVRIEGKIQWIAGVATNGTMMIILLMLYVVGF